MDFIVIGKVTAIVPSKYGISIKIHETQCGGRSKNGNRFGDKDNHWSCFVTNQASQRYVKANFRPGAIARAIALQPKYLFCDEPNSGLDPKTSLIIDRLIHDITIEFNITTIINSHDMNSVMEIGENIIFINKGEKAWQGSKEDIFHVDNEDLNDFVFASNLYKKVKAANS